MARLLKKAEDLDVFSKDALGRRKQASSANADQWIDEYLAEAYETSADDVRRLRKEVARWRSVYEEKYKPLRDRFFVHKELPSDAELQKLIASTRVDELERLCIFLISLHEALWQAYENGKVPIVEPTTHSVLEMLKPGHSGQSAPEIAAGDHCAVCCKWRLECCTCPTGQPKMMSRKAS